MAVANKFVCVHAFAAYAGLHKSLADLLNEIKDMPEIPAVQDSVFLLNLGDDVWVKKQAVIDGLQELINEHSSIATFREVLEDEFTPPAVFDEDEEEDLDDEEDDEEDDDFEDDDEEEDFDDDEDDDWEEVDEEDDDLDDDDDDDWDDDEEDDEDEDEE